LPTILSISGADAGPVPVTKKCGVAFAVDALQTFMSRGSTPDLILLDINMPGGTGMEVLKRSVWTTAGHVLSKANSPRRSIFLLFRRPKRLIKFKWRKTPVTVGPRPGISAFAVAIQKCQIPGREAIAFYFGLLLFWPSRPHTSIPFLRPTCFMP
jgi:hypothetical protein